MVFTSLKFLAFITLTIGVYFVFPKRFRWVWLLAASYLFYLSASVKYAVFLVLSTALTYGCALLVERIGSRVNLSGMEREQRKAAKRRIGRKKKWVVAFAILVNFGILFFIKYYNFALENISVLASALGLSFSSPVLALALPLGISFYTFQVTGYLIDVYRGVCEAQKNPLKYALFVSWFPQIMQGPIGRYGDLAPELFEGHSFDYDRAAFGAQRMLFGFFEKMVIADRLAIAVDTVFANYSAYGFLEVGFICVLYAIQIYADFAGYMDIALGAAEIMGIKMAENFDAPYFSCNVPEFWRRWHMTLGSWFRDYLFYPVMRSGWCTAISAPIKKYAGKKNASKFVTVIALACVWFFTGLWHGASWHYVAWGVYYGVLIILSTLFSPMIERLTDALHLDRERPSYKLAQMLRTFAIVCIGYVLFRADSLSAAKGILRQLVHISVPFVSTVGIGLDGKDLNVAFVSIFILFCVDILRYKKIDARVLLAKQGLWLRWLVYFAVIFAILIFGMYGPGYTSASFIYFQF